MEQLNLFGPTTKAKPKVTPRQEIFRALLSALGMTQDLLTPTERGRINRSALELAMVEATPDEVLSRWKVLHRRYPGMNCTERALISHWAECKPKANGAIEQTECPECSVKYPALTLRQHRYNVHDVGRCCVECSELIMPEDGGCPQCGNQSQAMM